MRLIPWLFLTAILIPCLWIMARSLLDPHDRP